jgi:hypothetical protein
MFNRHILRRARFFALLLCLTGWGSIGFLNSQTEASQKCLRVTQFETVTINDETCYFPKSGVMPSDYQARMALFNQVVIDPLMRFAKVKDDASFLENNPSDDSPENAVQVHRYSVALKNLRKVLGELCRDVRCPDQKMLKVDLSHRADKDILVFVYTYASQYIEQIAAQATTDAKYPEILGTMRVMANELAMRHHEH